jgi:mRNA-degrading endonuclease RelE of RelBE toxin-antitoxin system
MDLIKKLLKKIKSSDKNRILKAMERVSEGELRGVKLSGKNQYRIRVGNYRIKYRVESGKQVIDEVRRRDEKTYKN